MLNILFILWLITLLLGTILLCENEHYINLFLNKHYFYFSLSVPFKKKHKMNLISNSNF